MRRRRFLATSFRLAVGARAALLLGAPSPAFAAGEPTVLTDHQHRTLTLIARALLPHEFLTDTDYAGVARTIDGRAAEPGFRELVERGIAQLDGSAAGNWLEAPVDDQLSALQAIQKSEFFGRLLNTTIETLYRDPAIYRRLGYEGSSIEHGGYLYRGFDDIDWLPGRD